MPAPTWNSPTALPDCSKVPFPCGPEIASLEGTTWFPWGVATIGRALLDRVVCLFQHFGVSLPERRVWAVGEVPFDCDQLVVSLDSLGEGLIGAENQPPNPCNVPVTATFTVTVVRCYPVDAKVGPTKPDVLAAAADLAAIDAYLLMKLSGCLDMYGVDTGGAGGYGGMGTEASVSILDAQGGVQGVQLRLTTVVG